MVEQPILLPVVWERGPKWGDGGQPPADDALPPGLYLHQLPRLFTMSSDTMWQHTLVCKSTAAGDSNGNREESPPDDKGDDNGDDNFEFGFDED